MKRGLLNLLALVMLVAILSPRCHATFSQVSRLPGISVRAGAWVPRAVHTCLSARQHAPAWGSMPPLIHS
jgi:hypothetical protein